MGPSRRAERAPNSKVRGWKRDTLKTQHPDWTEERLQRELAQIYLRGNGDAIDRELIDRATTDWPDCAMDRGSEGSGLSRTSCS